MKILKFERKVIHKSVTGMFFLIFLFASLGCVRVHAGSLSQEKLNAVMQKFPDGKYWDHLCTDPSVTRSEIYQDSVTDVPCSHEEQAGSYGCNHFDGAGQCVGFARKIAYEYFGVLPGTWPQSVDMSQLKAGDIVRYHPGNQDHSIWVTAVNGETVTFADCNFSEPCRIRWNQTVTVEEIRASLIYITQAPDAFRIELDKNAAEFYTGESVVIHASVMNGDAVSDETVYWRTSDGNVVSVDPSGTVVGQKAGTAVITAYLAGDRAAANCTVTVKEKPSVKLNMSAVSVFEGKSAVLKAAVEGSTGKVSWSSSAPSVASVDQNGKVKGVKAGSAVITASVDGASARCRVKVKKTEIKLNKSSLSLYKGTSASLKAKVKGASKKVTWTSSKKSVATVKNGKITGKKAGTAVITAKANGKTAKCRVTVKNAFIKLNKTSATIYTSGTTSVQLKATVGGKSSKVTWKSSDAKIAAVSSKGKVTAKKTGKVTITAKANGKTAKCKVTVRPVLSKANAEKAMRKYVGNQNYYFNSCGEKEGKYYTYIITYRVVYTKFKYFLDMETGDVYESAPYLELPGPEAIYSKRYLFNAYDYL